MRKALVSRVGAHPVGLADQPVVLQFQCLLEGLPLISPRVLMLVAENARSGIAEHHYEFHAGRSRAIRSIANGWYM